MRNQRLCWTPALGALLAAALPAVAAGVAAPGAADGALPPWSAPPSTLVEVHERSFRSGDAVLSGTLHVPRVETRVPAVVVLHAASSPERTNPLYKHLIAMLPPMKVAVFVFDRCGSGRSAGNLEDSDNEMLADDGIAAQRLEAQYPRIDAQRIGFWGLSQGGWLALLAASRSPRTAFAVSVSAPMTTADVQMNFAVANILRIKGYSQADIDEAIAVRTAVDDFQRGRPDRASAQKLLDATINKPWFEFIYMERTFRDPDQSRWAREIRHDPLAVLSGVKSPALVLYGSADPWVPVQTSVERLRAAAARHPSLDMAVIAGAGHAMATNVAPADQIDPQLMTRAAPQSAEYFGVLGAWLARQGIATVP